MNTATEILLQHGVRQTYTIDFTLEAKLRIAYIKNYLRMSEKNGLVLGISGGIDSTTAGKLCQIACTELQAEGYYAIFYAVRLPYKDQADEDDARLALVFISPDKTITTNIKDGVDGIHKTVSSSITNLDNISITPEKLDFHKGNVKARVRMIAQYELAGLTNSLVVGTDHNSELVPAFYTKWGDQACDLTVLDGLNKRQVRLLGKELGAPEKLYKKMPTADLEEYRPCLSDEIALGFSYEELDDFLEGNEIRPHIAKKIVTQYEKTRHKRNWPVAYNDKSV